MKKLKIQDLKEEKIYKFAVNGNLEDLSESIYKIDEEGDLYCKDPCAKEFVESTLFYNEVINGCFVEIKREIDWTKVPRGTKVQIREGAWDIIWHNRYFIKYEKDYEKCFCTGIYLDDIFMDRKIEDSLQTYKYCRIHESVAIPEEWYKEVK